MNHERTTKAERRKWYAPGVCWPHRDSNLGRIRRLIADIEERDAMLRVFVEEIDTRRSGDRDSLLRAVGRACALIKEES